MSAALSFEALEDNYLQSHFAWVLEVLRAQDTRRLDDAACARRETTLALVEGYAKRGRFPRNTALLGRLLPVFVDEAGTTCAVAQLMIDTDHAELAEQLAAWMNFASVPEMAAAMPDEIQAWAAIAGLTPEEAALIQPYYCDSDPEDDYCSGWEFAPGQQPPCGNCVCEFVYHDGVSCCRGDGEGPTAPSECSASEQGICTNGDCDIPPPAPGQCNVDSYGDPCCLDGTTDCESMDGSCVQGTCRERESDSCATAGPGTGGASVAPLLAALFLLSLRRGGSPSGLRRG